jgi:hypothetical protein
VRRSEAAKLLGLAAAFDQRTVGEEDAIAWADVLRGLDPRDCGEAIRRHYTDSTAPIRPAQVRALVREIERAKAGRQYPPQCANPDCAQLYRLGKIPAPGERCYGCGWPLVLRQGYDYRCPGGTLCDNDRSPCPPGQGALVTRFRPYDALAVGDG